MWPATVLSACGLAVILTTASPQGISIFNRRRPTPAPTRPSGARGGACTSAENTPGVCDTINECPALKVHLANRNIGFLRRSICGNDATVLLCCPGRSAGQAVPHADTVQLQTRFLTHTRFHSPSSCGASSFSRSLVVGGDPVGQATDFPWMAALRYPERTGYPVHKCAGAVINERWVLTAAHCIEPDGPVSATLRDLILGSEIDDDVDQPPEDVEIEKIIKHPDYMKTYRAGPTNDIALIKLKKSLVFSELLRPLCLPKRKRTSLELEQVPGAFIAGWGLTAFGAEPSAHLLWGRVNVTDHTVCANNYANTGRSVTLEAERQLCANGNDLRQPGCDPAMNSDNCRGGVDTCAGDSGGPLMELRSVFNKALWFTIGIVSYGAGCGHSDLPGIYTRVDAYLDWIGDTVANN